MFEIEKGIEMPAASRRGRNFLYPWLEMDVGDSFLVPDKTVLGFGKQANQASRKYGLEFKVRGVEGGVRVWRAA